MKWTKEPPTEPGWYWWRGEEISRKVMAVVGSESLGFHCATAGQIFGIIETIGGEWWPEKIEPPEDSE